MKTKTDAAKIWKAAVYLRLSKDDGDSIESESIANQRDLINYFVKSRFDIQIQEDYIDDGFTGVNFERPSFQRMLNDIKSKKIDCVIVKVCSSLNSNAKRALK